ncbi:MAG: hypothetical protein R3E12_19695 [Candidatus Eisenbacteria bacterium]
MLQQTRVEAVLPYYERFLTRFPTVESLADAEEEEVLALWSGLDTTRARAICTGARRWCGINTAEPSPDRDAAQALPGIGRYTSAAIVSIAADRPHAVVDGNVIRVLARLFRLEPPEDRSMTLLERMANDLLSEDRPGDHNQAMMELGATVCLPKTPECPRCPVRASCDARASGEPDRYPRPAPKKATVELDLIVLLARDDRGRLLLERGRWKLIPHLWLPPILDSEEPEPRREPARPRRTQTRETSEPAGATLIREWIDRETGGRAHVSEPEIAGSFRHSITHHRIRFTVLVATIRRGPTGDHHQWVDEAGLESIGLSSVATKALRLERRASTQLRYPPSETRRGVSVLLLDDPLAHLVLGDFSRVPLSEILHLRLHHEAGNALVQEVIAVLEKSRNRDPVVVLERGEGAAVVEQNVLDLPLATFVEAFPFGRRRRSRSRREPLSSSSSDLSPGSGMTITRLPSSSFSILNSFFQSQSPQSFWTSEASKVSRTPNCSRKIPRALPRPGTRKFGLSMRT